MLTDKRYYPWLVWSVPALFVLYQFLIGVSPGVMVPQLMKTYSIDVVQVGVLTAAYSFSYLFLQIPSGLVADRFGVRIILIGGLLCSAVACFVFAVTNTYWLAVSARLIMGITSAPAIVCTLFLVAKWFPPRQFALIVGLTETLGMLGGALGEELLAHGVETIGWQKTTYIMSAVGLLLTVLIVLFVRDRKEETPEVTEPIKYSIWEQLREVMKLPQAWINGVFAALMFAFIPAFAGLWCVPFIQIKYDVSLIVAAGASALLFIGAAIGSPIVCWYSDVMGRRKPIMWGGTMIALLAILPVIYMPGISLAMTYALLFIFAFCSSVYMLPYAIMRDITLPSVSGTAMGYINMLTIMIGAPVLQPMIAWLLEFRKGAGGVVGSGYFALHDYQFALSLIPVCVLLALVSMIFIRETYCKQQ